MPRKSHNICINDLETGSALALLLAAAGYNVETDFCDGTVFIATETAEPDVRLLDGRPEFASFDLACQLRERLDNPIDEHDLAEMGSALTNVA